MKLFRSLVITLLFPISLMAQSFEGEIVYKMSYKDLPAEMKGMESMLPQNQTIWIKGTKSRFEQKTPQSNTIVISNSADGTSIILMDMMGQKFRLDIPKEQMDAKITEQSKAEVKYVEGTKEIAGYTCKKAEVTMAGFEDGAIFYYTEEIPQVKVQGMEALSLKGMFMAYEVSTKGMTISIEVSSINKSPVSDDKFIVPAGYSEMPAQIKSMMGIK